MSFTSLEFVFLFYPFVLFVYHFLNKKHPTKTIIFLIIVSLFFVYKANLTSLIVLAISVITNYLIAYYIQKYKHEALIKILVFSGVVFNISFLLSFKFFGNPFFEFFSKYMELNENLTKTFPLGLSFYTLYQISFLIDIYKKKADSIPFMKYLVSVSLFAQFSSGPIFSYKKIASQFKLLGKLQVERTMIYSGVSLFAFGLFKKIFFADPLTSAINSLYSSLNQGLIFTFEESLIATWGFLLQFYFDFSAYSDMAIGIGLSLGLKFPINFNSPLKATSVGDLVLRWHISFFSIVRDYVFLNISKSIRKNMTGSGLRKQLVGWVFGVFVSYIVIALWHSTSLHSLIIGVIMGITVILFQIPTIFFNLKGKKNKEESFLGGAQIFFKRILLLLIASLSLAAFRLNDIRKVGKIIKGFGNVSLENSLEAVNNVVFFGFNSLSIPLLVFILIATVTATYLPNTMEIFGLVDVKNDKWYHKFLWKPNLTWGLLVSAFLIFYLLIGHNYVKPFLIEIYRWTS
ncbi:MAG: alginate O-acetyltransferase complex protein AlgI [Polaribacter sp.]|jgi:alginate O-acetyltransferase complex protein AlgI